MSTQRTNSDSPARVMVDVLDKWSDGSRFGGSIKQIEFVEAAAYDRLEAEVERLRDALRPFARSCRMAGGQSDARGAMSRSDKRKRAAAWPPRRAPIEHGMLDWRPKHSRSTDARR